MLRRLMPRDRTAFLAAFGGLSQRSLFLRFHKLHPALRERDIAYLTEVDQQDHVALAVFAPGEGIAVGRFVRLDDPDRADMALTVVDAWQRRGVATLLMAALMHRARELGIARFEASVLDENRPAMALIGSLALERRREGASWLFTLPTDPADLPPGPLARRLGDYDRAFMQRRIRLGPPPPADAI